MADITSVLFTPAGEGYTDEDYERVSHQQPLPFEQLPIYLAKRDINPKLVPPKLWCGWRLSEDNFLQIAQDHFPETVKWTRLGKPYFGGTVISGTFLTALRKYCQIPDEDAELVALVQVVRPVVAGSPVEDDLVLAIGSTYNGIVAPAQRGNVSRLMPPGRELQWHLDLDFWGWCLVSEKEAKQYVKQRTAHGASTLAIAR